MLNKHHNSLLLVFSLLWSWGAIASANATEFEATGEAFNSAIPTDQTILPVHAIGAEKTDDNGMAQVTSASQLTDVKPTDWAFQALQSLVERYGCIVGYPDKTYRGNRALTRWEFAAGLNACLDKIQELIAVATSDFVRKEDLETVKRLQEMFAAELAALQGRVDALEVRTATLDLFKNKKKWQVKLLKSGFRHTAPATGLTRKHNQRPSHTSEPACETLPWQSERF